MTTTVIGLDPGESTGIAILCDGRREYAGQHRPSEALRLLGSVLCDLCPVPAGDTVVVVAEQFVITRNTTRHSQQPTALEVIGAARATAEHYRVPFCLQTPAVAKRMVPSRLLRQLGLWTKRRSPCSDANDANDAMRHAVTWLALHRASLFDQLHAAATAATPSRVARRAG